ncbi:MAG: ROK family transcriptional regulator [Chloroflexi bacterium]|nr:ROK family transcriptional regulator [Chloroflexota bacterium]
MVRSRDDKATHGQLRRHNRELMLRAVYNGVADNRAALAQETGLAKPTVSELIGELIDDGLLVEEGHGPSTEGGGKRPRLLKFVPTARHIIGISLSEERVFGALSVLDGRIVAQHYVDLSEAPDDTIVVNALLDVINGLMAQLDAPLLCIGIGTPGIVDSRTGIVSYIADWGWRDVPLAQLIRVNFNVPVYVASRTELAAMGQYVFGAVNGADSLATVLVGRGVGVGLVINSAPYHGGGDIGHLRMAARADTNTVEEDRLEIFLGWQVVKQRIYALRRAYPGSILPGENDPLSYLHLRYAAANGDRAALALQDELSRYLAQVFAWIIGLLRPDHISLAGPIANFGQPLLDQAVQYTQHFVLPDLVQRVTFSLTEAESSLLVAVGAVAQGLRRELGMV